MAVEEAVDQRQLLGKGAALAVVQHHARGAREFVQGTVDLFVVGFQQPETMADPAVQVHQPRKEICVFDRMVSVQVRQKVVAHPGQARRESSALHFTANQRHRVIAH